jgi:hypothetical protein
MTTTLWSPAEGQPAGQYRFQVSDDQGVTVITDGLAEVGPESEGAR